MGRLIGIQGNHGNRQPLLSNSQLQPPRSTFLTATPACCASHARDVGPSNAHLSHRKEKVEGAQRRSYDPSLAYDTCGFAAIAGNVQSRVM